MEKAFGGRKIIHVDMDAFYASVEQNDHPEYRGLPLVVAWKSNRSVVCAASYEARRYGIRSAMPHAEAIRKCRSVISVPPNFERYRAISREIHEIFQSYTKIVEKLSLDEAYLDVTQNLKGIPTATECAEKIRRDIKSSTGLTASAGVAPNKFLAKIASDWNKPDGIWVVKPHQILTFLRPLPLRKIMGVGKATEKKMIGLNITTMKELQNCSMGFLTNHFGKFGSRLYHLARGVDDNPVLPERPRKSLSKEKTFETDLTLDEIKQLAPDLVKETWKELQKANKTPKTIIIKLKTSEFKTISRQMSIEGNLLELKEMKKLACQILSTIDLPLKTKYRLLGAGFSNFRNDTSVTQTELF